MHSSESETNKYEYFIKEPKKKTKKKSLERNKVVVE